MEQEWRAECAWCHTQVHSFVGPPHMSRVTGQAADGQDVSTWDVCLECYTYLLRLVASVSEFSRLLDRAKST
jgi:hypothetical protein